MKAPKRKMIMTEVVTFRSNGDLKKLVREKLSEEVDVLQIQVNEIKEK